MSSSISSVTEAGTATEISHVQDMNHSRLDSTNASSIRNGTAIHSSKTVPVSTVTPNHNANSNDSLAKTSWNILDLAQWVPLRLTNDERALLTVLEQTLHVSEYTDNVDVTMYSPGNASYYRRYNGINGSGPSNVKTRRILDGILEVCHIATGLATASGQERKFIELSNNWNPSSSPEKQNTKIPSSGLEKHNTEPVNDANPNESPSTSTTEKQNIDPASEGKSNGNSGGGGIGISRITSLLSPKKQRKLDKEKKKLEKEQKRHERRLFKQKKNKKEKEVVESTNSTHTVTTSTTDENNLQQAESSGGIDTGMAHPTSPSISPKPPTPLCSNTPIACREPHENAAFFQTMFEIGRRNKVLNPSSMRTTYGKLMYLLQDAQNPSVAKSLGFSLHKDLLLVGPYLEQNQCLDLLSDPRLECAIQYISDRDEVTGTKLDRVTVQAMIKGKQHVLEELVTKYSALQSNTLEADDVRRVVESLADAVVYIESNVRPVRQMLQYLYRNFNPTIEEIPGSTSRFTSLSLRNVSVNRGGSNGLNGIGNQQRYYGLSAYGGSSYGTSEGPTLSHSHQEQYTFVEQSLKLWTKVMRHMHRLWVCADDDLLSTACTYHLYNTGQGLNRVQACSKVRKVMQSLLHQTQQETGKHWVGLSVIHLGDRDVPNALIFIDKYTQIPRFLNPIVNFVQSIPGMIDDERIANYIVTQFGSTENLKMIVLQDYFKHGFDGSGDDGGSCIDGRLTSSWNWTSRLAKKSYYHTFMLSGFQGFDGDFR